MPTYEQHAALLRLARSDEGYAAARLRVIPAANPEYDAAYVVWHEACKRVDRLMHYDPTEQKPS